MAVEALQRWRETQDANAGTIEQKNPYQKWVENDTRKTAIGAFCMNCMGTDDPDAPAPGYRADIKSCASTRCPLHKWRPYQ